MSEPGEPTVVVFTKSKRELSAGLDVSLGPCVPLPGRRRPLCSPLTQAGLEQPRHTAALYTVLTGNPAADALSLVEQDGQGRLFVWSTEYVSAVASKNSYLQALADEDEQRGDDQLASFTAALDALDSEWLAATDWPPQFVGTRNRLVPRLGTASLATQKGNPVWAWYGPSVAQFVIVSGQGPYPGSRE